MAHAQDGDAWITMQRHVNTVAVAQLKNLAGIVIVNGGSRRRRWPRARPSTAWPS